MTRVLDGLTAVELIDASRGFQGRDYRAGKPVLLKTTTNEAVGTGAIVSQIAPVCIRAGRNQLLMPLFA